MPMRCADWYRRYGPPGEVLPTLHFPDGTRVVVAPWLGAVRTR